MGGMSGGIDQTARNAAAAANNAAVLAEWNAAEALASIIHRIGTVTGADDIVAGALPSTYSSQYDKCIVAFEAIAANTGNMTLDIGAYGALPLRDMQSAEIAAGTITAGMIVHAMWDQSENIYKARIQPVQEISSVIATSVNANGNGVYTDLTSITIPAGVWDISGMVQAIRNTSTACTGMIGALSTTAGNSGAGIVWGETGCEMQHSGGNAVAVTAVIPPVRVTLAVPTVYYLKYAHWYTNGQPKGYGSIKAKRVR